MLLKILVADGLLQAGIIKKKYCTYMYKMIIATSFFVNHFCISTFGACLLSNFVMLYVYWVKNDDLKTRGKTTAYI